MKRYTIRALIFTVIAAFSSVTLAADPLTLWFAPSWKAKRDMAKEISQVLSGASGLTINPRIAKDYPDILEAFSTDNANIVYVGSFVQAILRERGLGETLVQAVTGEEYYSGVLVYPKGGDPVAILANSPSKIAYAIGASSGESSAKAATDGAAAFGTKNHSATLGAIKAGKANAGVVKNWWWAANKDKYPRISMYEIPSISIAKNPDNVLCASRSISDGVKAKLIAAAKANSLVFGASSVIDVDPSALDFTASLMKKGKIDPLTYSW